jgi:hypothetical protein
VFGCKEPHGLLGYRRRREDCNIGVTRGADCFHSGGKRSQAVLDEHKKVAGQNRCDPITRTILELMPEMLHLDPIHRPTAQELRQRLEDIINAAKRRLLQGASQPSYETPKRQNSRSTTNSSTPGSTLGPRRNRRLTSPNFDDGRHENYTTISGAPRTEEPRTLSYAVTSASKLLEQQIVSAGQVANSSADGACSPPHRLRLVGISGNGYNDHLTPLVKPMSPVQDPGLEKASDDQTKETRHSYHSPSSGLAQAHAATNDETTVRSDTTSTGHSSESGHQQPRKPPVKLLFKDAVEWKRQTKASGSVKKLPDENLRQQLSGRDHVSSTAIATLSIRLGLTWS